MTNFEYYKDQFLAFANDDRDPVITINGEIAACDDIDCERCLWCCPDKNCGAAGVIWGYSEHKECNSIEINLDGLKLVLTEE